MEDLCGKDASNAFQAIVASHPNLAEVALIEYPSHPLLQDRLSLTKSDQQVLKEARHLRTSLGIPFWDAIMLSCEIRDVTSENLLDAAMFHRSFLGQERWISRDAVKSGELQRLCEPTDGPQLAITSHVRDMNGAELHIPMLDVHCSVSDAHLTLVEHVASRLLPNGAIILESDKSYHLYGLVLLTPSNLIDFLAKALLFAPILDRAYIAHQLLERRCLLRLSARQDKKQVPKVVKVLSWRV